MLIVCPSCASEYNIDAAHLGSEGRRVRCFNCNTDWFALPQTEAEAESGQPDGRSMQDYIDEEWQRAAAEDSEIARINEDEASRLQGSDIQNSDIAAEVPQVVMEAAQMEAEQAATVENMDNSQPDIGGALSVVAQDETLQRRRKKTGGTRAPLKAVIKTAPRSVAGAMAICGALVLMLGIWQRDVVVRHAPALAAPFEKIGLGVNTRGLEFEKVVSELVSDPSGRFLVVQSVVRNITSRQVQVPQIEIVVRDNAGKPVYTWATEPPKTSLTPGEALSFRTRLAAPPQEGHDVILRFLRSSGQMTLAQK